MNIFYGHDKNAIHYVNLHICLSFFSIFVNKFCRMTRTVHYVYPSVSLFAISSLVLGYGHQIFFFLEENWTGKKRGVNNLIVKHLDTSFYSSCRFKMYWNISTGWTTHSTSTVRNYNVYCSWNMIGLENTRFRASRKQPGPGHHHSLGHDG